MAIKAPIYSEKDLRAAAEQFLEDYHPERTIPVPIEEIIDNRFEIDIVPVPGLHRNFDIDAFITSDLQEIRVDDDVYKSRQNRYRFSLAHELAHKLLHADVFCQLQFSTVTEWKAARSLISEREYRFIEWHANTMAGLVLVPPARLAEQFEAAKQRLERIGISIFDAPPVAWDSIESWLSEYFVVSTQVIARRGPADGLWDA